jgi:hypothetical protein
MNFDIDKYSALVLFGVDGTIHEGLYGPLRREDGKKFLLACCLMVPVMMQVEALVLKLEGFVKVFNIFLSLI